MGICTEYYLVDIGGVKTVVSHVYTKVEEGWFNIDGTEITDAGAIENIRNQATEENKINAGKAFFETLDKVEWTKIPIEWNADRRGIVLKKSDMLLAEDENGTQYNIAMLSRFGVVDMGAPQLPFNINASDRPTVQYPGQSGENANKIAYLSDLQNKYVNAMLGELKFPENALTSQLLPALEQSYIDDLGAPDNINDEPYDETNNNYEIGEPYFVIAWFDDTLTFHYNMYGSGYTYNGFLLDAILSVLKDLNKKISDLSSQVTLEPEPEPEPEPGPSAECTFDFTKFWTREEYVDIVSSCEMQFKGKASFTIAGINNPDAGTIEFDANVTGLQAVVDVYPDFKLCLYVNTQNPEDGFVFQEGDNHVVLSVPEGTQGVFFNPYVGESAGTGNIMFDSPIVVKQGSV